MLLREEDNERNGRGRRMQEFPHLEARNLLLQYPSGQRVDLYRTTLVRFDRDWLRSGSSAITENLDLRAHGIPVLEGVDEDAEGADATWKEEALDAGARRSDVDERT